MPDFSDIFIASPEQAAHYDVMEPNCEHVNINYLTDHEISILWASILRTRVKAKYQLQFADIEEDDDSRALVYEIPAELTELLAALDEQQIITSASLWIEAEDVHWTAHQAQEKLREIKNLAVKAIQENKILFLILN